MDDARLRQDPFVRGINTGICFLGAAPFLLVGGAGGVLWYLARRGRRDPESGTVGVQGGE